MFGRTVADPAIKVITIVTLLAPSSFGAGTPGRRTTVLDVAIQPPAAETAVHTRAVRSNPYSPSHARSEDVFNDPRSGRAAGRDGALTVGRASSPPPPEPGTVQMLNEVLTFEWPDLPHGFGFYTSMNTDHGRMGGGSCDHWSQIGDGTLHVITTRGPCGTSWEGRWISLSGTAADENLTVDCTDPMPTKIAEEHRLRVVAVRIRVKGTGQFKLEIKRPEGHAEPIAHTSFHTVDTTEYEDQYSALPADIGLPECKLLNIVVESVPLESDLYFDQIDFVCDVPEAVFEDPLLYGTLTAYCQILRGFDPSGVTRDHINWPAGDFDSVPAMGLQILTAAAAYDLGFVSLDEAQDVAERTVATLLAIDKEPTSGLLPHWLQDGQIHPNSEWTSVDTAIASIAAVEGLTALGMTGRVADVYTQLIDDLHFPAFTAQSGEIAYGLYQDGTVIPYYWTQWGGELTLVEVWRAMHDRTLPSVPAYRDQQHYQGTGFIIELAGLFFPHFGGPDFGPDQYGIDWHGRRAEHLVEQAAYRPVSGQAIFGLSAVEIMRYEDAVTEYLVAGVGTATPPSDPRHSLPGFGPEPWIAPHYMSMVSALDLAGVDARLRYMRDDLGVWPPLNGPAEAVQLVSDDSLSQWHRVQVSLNVAFNVLGLYHAICARDGRVDELYLTADAEPHLREAVYTVFCGLSTNAADADIDGDVDLADFAKFSRCFSGANVLPPDRCRCLDFDTDSDIDLDDYEIFSVSLIGP